MADTDNAMFKKAYHVTQGEVLMYTIDAQIAVANFPDEWSSTPWDAEGEPVAEGDRPTRRQRRARPRPSEGDGQ
jgi:hypothetical protein